MSERIKIFDTTLRDGTQGEGISLSVEDKLKIAMKLDELGVHYIEGGWPGSNSKDIEFFERVRHVSFKHAKVTAFGSTRRKNIAPDQDINLKRILDSHVQVATIFGKSWDFHVHTAIQTTLEENLSMIYDSVKYLREHGLEVIYDAEHFFDGYKQNPDYALETLKHATRAGADWVVLCDTNGGTLPSEISAIITTVKQTIDAPIGIHAHNDSELAVANTISAVEAGARQVQGTINGYGERCGNANLCSIIPNLQLKLKYTLIDDRQLQSLTKTARYISEVANMNMPINQPFVGNAAFAHKGGIHVSAIQRDASTYEHIIPELVGNKQRVLVSELAGQSNVIFKAQEMHIDTSKETQKTKEIIEKIKRLEHQGYQFEGADASLELLIREAFEGLEEIFVLESFKILVEKVSTHDVVSEAIVKVKVHGETIYTAAEGNGPVNALDNALRKALVQFYPDIEKVHLSDYKVRVLDEKDATAAKVRVLIETTDYKQTWNTLGVSNNIIEASWYAMVDSLRYALLNQKRAQLLPKNENERQGLINH